MQRETELRAQIARLEAQADLPATVVRAHGASEAGDPAAILAREEASSAEKTLSDAAKATSRRAREALQAAYRFAGLSLFPCAPDELGLRFETSHGSAFFESYFVVLGVTDEGDDAAGLLTVRKHSLPAFVPLSQLVGELLNRDLGAFVARISDFVNAFVARREALRELVAEHGASLANVQSTATYDCVGFERADPLNAAKTVSYRLIYDDLAEALPTRCAIVSGKLEAGRKRRRGEGEGEGESASEVDDDDEVSADERAPKRFRALEDAFLTRPLREAFVSSLREAIYADAAPQAQA